LSHELSSRGHNRHIANHGQVLLSGMVEHEDASITSGEPAQNTANARPRAIRFTQSMDMVILEFVNETGAHIAPYGQSHKLFERTTSACRAHPSFAGCVLSVKSVWDRFKKIIVDHKKVDAEN
jgi:hypothetical protein